MNRILTHGQLLQLKRWNTPTIYNGWEVITEHDRRSKTNVVPVNDFMPAMGPMIGYAVTVRIEPSNPKHQKENPNVWPEYRKYISGVPGPKIVVIQDMDQPYAVGSFWGEVNANVHRAQGCVGTITDGAVRDLDEMTNAGFKAIARQLCVGHAYSCPIEWDVEVEVFGRKVRPGQLIHADKHGFIILPEEDQEKLLEAVLFMDQNECNTVIPAARSGYGKSESTFLQDLRQAGSDFSNEVKSRDKEGGEW